MARWNIVNAAGVYKGRSLGIDGQECTNLYAEVSASEGSKNTYALIGTPGMKLLSAVGVGGCRGLFVSARDRLFMITDNKFYEVTSNWASIEYGTLKTSSGRCYFSEIDKQLDPTSAAESQILITDGANGYIFNTLTNIFSDILSDYLPGTSVASQNGFFLQTVNDNNKFIYSNYLDGTTWEASLNYFAAESSPDPILQIFLINNQVWLLGSKTIEIWNFTGNSDELWIRSSIGQINTGTAGRYCATTLVGNIFWVGSDREGQNIIWQSGPSYSPQRISTHAIEYILGQMSKVDDCIALSYQYEGHMFAIFNFPTGNRTLVYDLSTQLWHERGYYNQATGLNDRHRVSFIASWQGKILIGDDANSNLYEWSLDQFTDNGNTIKRVRVCPHIHAERKRIFFHQAEIDLERGVGIQDSTATLTAPPTVNISVTDLGDSTYVLTPAYTGNIAFYAWNLHDGTSSSDTTGTTPTDATVVYGWAGTQTVSISVRAPSGTASDSTTLVSAGL